jgi:hypothetical protein
MKFTTIALASVFALSSTYALASSHRHERSARIYLHRGMPLTSSRFLRSNAGNPNGNPGGPTSLSGTGSSSFGGSSPGTSGYN